MFSPILRLSVRGSDCGSTVLRSLLCSLVRPLGSQVTYSSLIRLQQISVFRSTRTNSKGRRRLASRPLYEGHTAATAVRFLSCRHPSVRPTWRPTRENEHI